MSNAQPNVDRAEIVDLFSVPLLVSSPFHPSEAEMAFLRELPTVLNRGGGRVSEDSTLLRRPELARIAAFVAAQLETYGRDVACLAEGTSFVVTQSWLNVTGQGARHHVHRHPNSIVSGVLYLQGDSAPTRLFRDLGASIFGGMEPRVDATNRFNRAVVEVDNVASRLILFPSSLLHEVAEYTGTMVRMSIAFNAFLSGRLGRKRKLTSIDVRVGHD